MADNLSDYTEQKLADLVFGATAWSIPGTYYLALSTADPTENGSGLTEPVGNNYSRLSVTNNKTNFSNAVASGGGYEVHNAVDLTFANPSGAWGTITHAAVMDASGAGNMIAYGPLSTPKVIDAASAPVKFPIAALGFTFK